MHFFELSLIKKFATMKPFYIQTNFFIQLNNCFQRFIICTIILFVLILLFVMPEASCLQGQEVSLNEWLFISYSLSKETQNW